MTSSYFSVDKEVDILIRVLVKYIPIKTGIITSKDPKKQISPQLKKLMESLSTNVRPSMSVDDFHLQFFDFMKGMQKLGHETKGYEMKEMKNWPKEVEERFRQETYGRDFTDNDHKTLLDILESVAQKKTELDAAVRRCPVELKETIRFKDLAGMRHEKESMLVNYIYPNKFKSLYPSTEARHLLLYGPPGCFAPGTEVLLYNGNIKKVEDVQEGDQLMGDDSTVRVVLQTCEGEDEMYEVHPEKGRSYTVNSKHSLVLMEKTPYVVYDKNMYKAVYYLKGSMYHQVFSTQEEAVNFLPTNLTFEITMEEYLKLSESAKQNLFTFHQAVEYPEDRIEKTQRHRDIKTFKELDDRETGDQRSEVVKSNENSNIKLVGKNTHEIGLPTTFDYLLGSEYALSYLSPSLIDAATNPKYRQKIIIEFADLSDICDCYNVGFNIQKYFPDDYLITSRKNRLDIMAGIIDSDNCYTYDGSLFNIKFHCMELLEKIERLALSLGFMAEIRYPEVFVYGEGLQHIILRKKAIPRRTTHRAHCLSFNVIAKGIRKYHGFSLTGNHRFLLKDFKVVRNTGKTLLVKAASTELKEVAFFAPNPADLKGKFEGATEKNIQAQFACARHTLDTNRKYKRAVIFFDEFDAIARKRSEDDPSTARTVNTLLQMIGGINSDPRISVIAATNLPSILDEGIQRRFTTKLFVSLPDEDSRRYIIENRIGKMYLLPDQKCDEYKKDECYKMALNNIKKYTLGGGINEKEVLQIVKITGQDKGDYKGYSASDLNKMIDICFNKIATRTVRDIYSKNKVFFVKENINNISYYIQTTENLKDLIKASDIPEEAYDNVLTFDLFKKDFEDAMVEYPPTVSKSSFENVESYAKHE